MCETEQNRRKRLRFRSWHRGTRELDLILGRFADHHLDGMTTDQLDRYEALIANADPDIFRWISGQDSLPPAQDNDIMFLLKNFRISAE